MRGDALLPFAPIRPEAPLPPTIVTFSSVTLLPTATRPCDERAPEAVEPVAFGACRYSALILLGLASAFA